MTVKELVEQLLKEGNPDAAVLTWDAFNDCPTKTVFVSHLKQEKYVNVIITNVDFDA
jgi:hypothetical protein